MARPSEIHTEDLDRLVADIAKMPDALRKAMYSRGLDAAGEILAEEQRESIIKKKLVKDRHLLNSIKIKKSRTGGYVDVFPGGERPDGTKNALVGFVQEYGREGKINKKGKRTRKMAAKGWMEASIQSAEDDVQKAIEDIFDEVLAECGWT